MTRNDVFDDKIYTTKTMHAECEERLSAKCRWEHMSRMSVLRNYRDIVCKACQDHVRSNAFLPENKGGAE